MVKPTRVPRPETPRATRASRAQKYLERVFSKARRQRRIEALRANSRLARDIGLQGFTGPQRSGLAPHKPRSRP